MGPSDGTGHISTEQLFREHSAFVARFLARLGVPPDHIEDALQEVFLVVHRHGGYRPGIAKPTSYLANIALRAAAQHRRRQAVAATRSSSAPVEEMASEKGDPAHALQAHEDLERFQLALERLPDELRTALLLVEVEGESCISVAAGLGCPVGTIYWRVHQARKKLQSSLTALHNARREPRTQPRAALDKRAVPVGALIMFDFRSAEWDRMLRLAREQRHTTAPVDELLAQHQQLVQSGAELPAWASGFAPHSASWLSVVGFGPIAGACAVGAVTALLMLAPSAEPRPQSAQLERPAQVPVAAPAAKPEPAVERARPELVPSAEQAPAPPPPIKEAAVPIERNTRSGEAAIKSSPARSAAVASVPSTSARNAGVGSSESARSEAAVAEDPPPVEEKEEPAQEAKAEPVERTDPTVAEMREVAQAERLLASDPEETLEITQRMRARFENGYFAQERSYLEVMALQRLGRTQELRTRASAFLRAYPQGPYTARVRDALASARK